MKLYRLLQTKVVGRTVGDWLACLTVAPLGGLGWWLMFRGQVWTGALCVALAQLFYYLIMGFDVDNHRE